MVTRGALLTVFMGHGGGELSVPDLADVVVQERQPMYTWFACSTGDFIGTWDSDAEVVLRQEGGPMAALVSTATTHPYANAVNALEMERALFVDMPGTFGEAIGLMKWRTLYNLDEFREMIDAFAVLYMEEWELEGTKLDHMYSYNLLGDPAVRTRFPAGKAALDLPESVLVEGELEFAGTVDNLESGTAHVKVVCERARILHPLEPLENPQAEENWEVVQDNWEKANDNTVAETVLDVVGGEFDGSLTIPQGTPAGTYYLSVYAEDGLTDAVGSESFKVKK